MEKFIGTKQIRAKTMNHEDYNKLRGWELPDDENGADEGYLVEYLDGGEPNLDGYAGYVSWSPKEQFDNAYRPTTGMNFGLALEALNKDLKVARAGWNGKGMWLIKVQNSNPTVSKDSACGKAGLSDVKINAHIDMMTATGEMQPGWLASQTDMLADDWQIVD